MVCRDGNGSVPNSKVRAMWSAEIRADTQVGPYEAPAYVGDRRVRAVPNQRGGAVAVAGGPDADPGDAVFGFSRVRKRIDPGGNTGRFIVGVDLLKGYWDSIAHHN